MTISKFDIGDRVKKIVGWKYFGVVVSAFTTTKGEQRYVVENTGENEGQLFIFNEAQLAVDDCALSEIARLRIGLELANISFEELRVQLADCRAGVPSDGAIYAAVSKRTT